MAAADPPTQGTDLPGPEFRAGYVAIAGKPNVGKSTLMNGLLGQKISIVTPKPQTTRHRLLGILSTDAYQMVFLDTPGLIAPRYALQSAMMRSVDSALADADVVLYLVDVTEAGGPPASPERATFERLARLGKPVLLALNKIDLANPDEVRLTGERFASLGVFRSVHPVSALKTTGTADLLAALVQHIPVHPPYYPPDIVSEHSERFFVSEIIREKIFLMLREEIPYSTTVDIVEFKEREGGKWFVSADIYVERNSQKGILIGVKGAMLKQLGSAARRDIEEFLQHPVFLDLHVRVKERWREDGKWLRRLGYDG